MSASVGQVAMLPTAVSTYETTTALADVVREQCPRPVSVLQIAALLEAAGLTDAIAQRQYGYLDVFTLADAVQRDLTPTMNAPVATAVTLPPIIWREKLSDYARGPLTLLPIFFLSLIVGAYQAFGHWQNQQVWVMGFAMLGSLLVTSGFVQAASRKGSGYLSQGYVRAAGRVTGLVLGSCLVVALLVAGVGTAVLLLTGWLPAGDVALLVVAYVALSCLWLVAASLFLVQQVVWYGIALGIGVGLSYLALQGGLRSQWPAGQTLLLATAAGLAGLLLTAALVVRRAFRQRALASPVGHQPVVLPPLPHLMVNLTPYFLYGVLYVLLIIAGHAPGWFGRLGEMGVTRETAVSTVEASLTLALGGFILVGGVAEHTIRRFWQHLKLFQLQSPGTEPALFNSRLSDFFRRERAIYLWALLFCTGLVLGVVLLWLYSMARGGSIPSGWLSPLVTLFVMGLIGYGWMAWGIFNCMFLISLSQPGMAITAVLIAIVLTLFVGGVTSQLLTYEYSAVGMVVGNLAFAWLSTRQVRQVWQHADYYYYASF
jgi:hypothetical protein